MSLEGIQCHVSAKSYVRAPNHMFHTYILSLAMHVVSGTIIRGTLKTPNSQLVTPISIKLQRPDGHD
jgi:hypothetical protein